MHSPRTRATNTRSLSSSYYYRLDLYQNSFYQNVAKNLARDSWRSVFLVHPYPLGRDKSVAVNNSRNGCRSCSRRESGGRVTNKSRWNFRWCWFPSAGTTIPFYGTFNRSKCFGVLANRIIRIRKVSATGMTLRGRT